MQTIMLKEGRLLTQSAIDRVTRILVNTNRSPKELIKQRRIQLLVHSFCYYEEDDPIISDQSWQDFANDLVVLQDSFPEACKIDFYDDAFADWDGSTGMHLPKDEWVRNKSVQVRALFASGN